MIQKFVDRFYTQSDQLKKMFSEKEPEKYSELVKAVITVISDGFDISPNRIHQINAGDYQGTLLYVIGACGYPPNEYYYYVKVSYGSCSVCDTLQGIQEEANKEVRIEQFMLLALHIVQGLKKMGETE